MWISKFVILGYSSGFWVSLRMLLSLKNNTPRKKLVVLMVLTSWKYLTCIVNILLFSLIFFYNSTTTLAAGETGTPILRSSAGNNNDMGPTTTSSYDNNASFYGGAYGQLGSPYRSNVNGAGQDPQQPLLHQISLSSPPPPPLPANFKNADFF
jgi:hypothetical protein